MTRRSLFGLLPAAVLPVVAVAATQPSVTVETWPYETETDGIPSNGIHIVADCSDPHFAGFEIIVSVQHGRGAPEKTAFVVSPWEPFCGFELNGDESCIQVEVTALIRSGMRAVETVIGKR